MQTTYRVPFGDAESEFTEKRSRFISHLWRVETEAEARQHIEETKKPITMPATTAGAISSRRGAWSVTPMTGASQGTAGQPMLNVFQRREVTKCAAW